MLAKSRMVLGSPMSRLKATWLMVRCCSTSQAVVSVSAALMPKRGHKLRGDARARDGVVLVAALGDVVQEGRHVERAAVLDGLEDARRQRMRLGRLAVLDVGQHADGADQMLVHREVVVHVELHHGHDLAELGHEAAEHAGLVHAPQRRLGVLRPSTACRERCGWPRDRCAACRRSAAATGAAAARRRDGRRRPSARPWRRSGSG